MEKKFEHIEDIIAKFLSGEATAQEISLLEEWKSLNTENAHEFSQYEKLFGESSKIGELIDVDTDAAWDHVRESLHSSKKGRVISLEGRKQFPVFLRIAAIILLAVGLGIAVYFIAGREESNYAHVTTTDSIRVVNLPDGSLLTLNRNSSVSYSTELNSGRRIVKLTGEAFFQIKHDSLSPLIVETGGINIKDIGTAFNVNARPGSNRIIVTVTEGEVQLITALSNSVFVSAGEEARYDVHTKNIEMSDHIDKNISSYKDKIFIFENAELTKVVKVLNDIYETNLELSNDSIGNCRITVSFNNEQIDVIAEVIAETLGLTLSRENDKIIFKGDACK